MGKMAYQIAKHIVLFLLLLVQKSFGDEPALEKLEWVLAKSFQPHEQELAGVDTNSNLFIGRATYPGGGQAVGAFHPAKPFEMVVDGNVLKTELSRVTVLKYCRGAINWSRRSLAENPPLPPNMLLVGFSPTKGENVYACRARKGQKLIPGQLIISVNKGCQIIEDGKLHYMPDYEVASLSLYAIAAGCIKGADA